MEWMNESLGGDYDLIGDIVKDSVVRLYIRHPKGDKLLRIKHMNQVDIDNSSLDDIRTHFSRLIDNIQSKTLEQLQITCN